MDLVLIRHPAPAVDFGVCYGKTDVPLAEDPAHCARAVAARLVALGVPSPSHLVTSPLQRCAQLAEHLARHFDCDWGVDARVQEIDFGDWEGRRWDAIERVALDAWAADLRRARMHGGESVEQFESRVGQWLDIWREREGQPSPSVHVVTHAGVIRMIGSLALGESLESMLRRPLEMAAVVWLRRERGAEAWTLLYWNV